MKLGHTLGSAAKADTNSSVTVRGSKLPKRMRTSGTARHTASTRSVRVCPVLRSRPQEEISMPVSTISRYPSLAKRRLSATASSIDRERTLPRA